MGNSICGTWSGFWAWRVLATWVWSLAACGGVTACAPHVRPLCARIELHDSQTVSSAVDEPRWVRRGDARARGVERGFFVWRRASERWGSGCCASALATACFPDTPLCVCTWPLNGAAEDHRGCARAAWGDVSFPPGLSEPPFGRSRLPKLRGFPKLAHTRICLAAPLGVLLVLIDVWRLGDVLLVSAASLCGAAASVAASADTSLGSLPKAQWDQHVGLYICMPALVVAGGRSTLHLCMGTWAVLKGLCRHLTVCGRGEALEVHSVVSRWVVWAVGLVGYQICVCYLRWFLESKSRHTSWSIEPGCLGGHHTGSGAAGTRSPLGRAVVVRYPYRGGCTERWAEAKRGRDLSADGYLVCGIGGEYLRLRVTAERRHTVICECPACYTRAWATGSHVGIPREPGRVE
jgi:hypothetical protein